MMIFYEARTCTSLFLNRVWMMRMIDFIITLSVRMGLEVASAIEPLNGSIRIPFEIDFFNLHSKHIFVVPILFNISHLCYRI